MATDKRVFTLRLREKNFEKIKVIADKNKRSIAMQIEYLIEQHIEAYKKEKGIISPDKHNDVQIMRPQYMRIIHTSFFMINPDSC